MKQIARRVLLAALLASAVPTLHAQSAVDGFNVNLNGPTRVVVVQADGKVLLGGDFTAISTGVNTSAARNRIVRLNPDGSLDAAFNAGANGTVRAIAVQADGRVLIGGDFTIVDGRQTRNHIARLDGVTGAVDAFDPNANDFVSAIAVARDGKIVVGGDFTNIDGQTRLRIARLDPTGAVDSFNPRADAQINSIVIQPDTRIVAGGNFTNIGGQSRNHIGRLDAVSAQADSFNPNANAPVIALALEPNGDVLVGGSFAVIGGHVRRGIARLNASTGASDGFNPNADESVFSIAVQFDGGIVVGGQFANIGGEPRNRIARLNPFTGLADAFDPNANNVVLSVAAQQDGKVVAGGFFTTLTPNASPFAFNRARITRLEVDGRVDQTLNLGNIGSGLVLATGVQTDGKIVLGGLFDNIFGAPRHNLARLNTDGTVDDLFDPEPNSLVRCITVEPDGNILVGGDFTIFSPFSGPVTRHRIARLEPVNGTVDPAFNPDSSGPVAIIALQRDRMILVGGQGGGFNHIGGLNRVNLARLNPNNGQADSTFDPHPLGGEITCMIQQPNQSILVGGSFTNIGGQPRRGLARLNPNGAADNQFHPDPTGTILNGDIFAIALQGDQKILVGGAFTNIGGAAHTNMARLEPIAGAADNSFNANADDRVEAIMVQADGHIIAGGAFSNIANFPRPRIARLQPSGPVDLQFNPSPSSANNGSVSVLTLALQADGKILVGGQFDFIGGQVRNNFARLTNDTAALQNLALTQSSVTWNRSGSSPQFNRATFEFSTDNVNFTLLGEGSASGSNWVLGGQNLPIGQNFVIRARGFYGCASGSALGFRRNRSLVVGPVITTIATNPAAIWPPNHKFTPVTVMLDVTDDTDPSPVCNINSITFVDPSKDDDDDDAAAKKIKPAYQITGNLSANLLAGPKGRVYTIGVQCTDNSNHSATASINIPVPHDQKNKK